MLAKRMIATAVALSMSVAILASGCSIFGATGETAEIKEAAKQSRRDLDELKKQVKAEAKEVKKTVDEKLDLHDVEREMRRDRIRAEAEHNEAVKQLKKDVQTEAKELKKLMENES